MQTKQMLTFSWSAHLAVSTTNASMYKISHPMMNASINCRCSSERKMHLHRQMWSSKGKPFSVAPSLFTPQHWLALPGCNHRRLISSLVASCITPRSNDRVPPSGSVKDMALGARDLRLAAVTVACTCESVLHTVRKPESSCLSWSSCSLMNFTFVALRRSATRSATFVTVPQPLSSSALASCNGLPTGSMEHSENTLSQCARKQRNSWNAPPSD
mmetsp:Transcript_87349/g.242275  ORF Transcript_87349/g.242275 Transcript_87349/m.242275 type:complete len:215 (-) Transcript_87349:115-759(-)